MLKLLSEFVVSFALVLILIFIFVCSVYLALRLFRKAPNLLKRLLFAYLIRIPILTILGIWLFCIAALLLPGTRSLLGNAFDLMSDKVDVGQDPSIGLGTDFYFAIELAIVSFFACLLGATAMVTRHLVRLYGRDRFSTSTKLYPTGDSASIGPNITLKYLLFYQLVTAGPVVVSVLYKSIASSTLQETPLHDVLAALAFGLGATFLGVACLGVFLWSISWVQRRYTRHDYANPVDGTVSDARDIVGRSPDIFYPTRSAGGDSLPINQARNHSLSERQSRWAARISSIIGWLFPLTINQATHSKLTIRPIPMTRRS